MRKTDEPRWARGLAKPPAWRSEGPQTVFDSPWMAVTRHPATAPTGMKADYAVVRFKNVGTGVLPVHDDGTVGASEIDLVVDAGDLVLLVGQVGSGKSSLLAALRGAASFEGNATVDGMPVSALSPTQWLAWCGQQPGLIAGTIAENVTLGDADGVTDGALVARALELAQAGDLDPRLSLGVQGAGLSGGQAQRVAIARAFFRHLRGRAPVLALDEPSSALDADTEAEGIASLKSLLVEANRRQIDALFMAADVPVPHGDLSIRPGETMTACGTSRRRCWRRSWTTRPSACS